MTTLATTEDLQLLNIDTIERAIAYSAFLLRAAIVGTNSANNTATNIRLVTAYRQTADDFYGELQIEASLPYNSYLMLRSGGDFLANLI